MKGKMYSNIKVEGNGDWGDEKVKNEKCWRKCNY